MSYDDESQGVRLEGEDLDAARNFAANAAQELQALGRLVAQKLGQPAEAMDQARRIIGVEVRLPSSPAVYTFCDYTTGDCLGVWDDAAGVCRPCGPGDTGCTPHPHVEPPK